MFPALALAALLTTATTTTATTAATKSVLVLDLTPSDVPANTAKLLTELVTDATAKNGLRTVSAADLRKVAELNADVGSSRVDLQACKLEYSIVSPK